MATAEVTYLVTAQQQFRFDARDEQLDNIGSLIMVYDCEKKVMFIDSLQVVPEYRMQGIATRLVEQAITAPFLTGLEVKQICLKPEPFNDMPMSKEALIKFYGKFGFAGPDEAGYMTLE